MHAHTHARGSRACLACRWRRCCRSCCRHARHSLDRAALPRVEQRRAGLIAATAVRFSGFLDISPDQADSRGSWVHPLGFLAAVATAARFSGFLDISPDQADSRGSWVHPLGFLAAVATAARFSGFLDISPDRADSRVIGSGCELDPGPGCPGSRPGSARTTESRPGSFIGRTWSIPSAARRIPSAFRRETSRSGSVALPAARLVATDHARGESVCVYRQGPCAQRSPYARATPVGFSGPPQCHSHGGADCALPCFAFRSISI